MSRQREAIRKAATARGLVVKEMQWENWYDGGEMVGVAGGWFVTFEDERCEPLLGVLTATEAVEWIQRGWCDPRTDR